ncbi:MAG: PadR family transcriptional regulator [Candidatus Brocadiia bacterium]
MQTWATQVRKGLIELWILGHLSQGQSYGYQLRELLFEGGQKVPGATVCRVLARFHREGWITVHDGYSPLGPRRRYCRLSPKGERRLAQMKRHWQAMARATTEKSLRTKG